MQKPDDRITPKVLLVFGYERKSWILPFEEIKDEFQFVYLRYIHPSEEELSYTNEEKIYWSQFSNAQEILNMVKPIKVVFMSIYNGLDMALNAVCKRNGIPSYIFQHGLFTVYNDYRQREILFKRIGSEAPKNSSLQTSKQNFSTLRFLINSLSALDLLINWKASLYFYFQKKESSMFASRHFRFKARIPDYYICFSPKNARIHFELDNPDQQRFHYIGCPEFDLYFKSLQSSSIINGKYFLHIDQAFAGNRFGESIVNKEKMSEFINKLNEFSTKHSSFLVVKLHPENYNNDWFPVHENIIYIRGTNNIVSLIKNASGCFGFFSTLLIPAVFFNKVILFKISDSDFQNDMMAKSLVLLLDFTYFQISEIDFNAIAKQQSFLKSLEEEYFYKTDGNSLGRLKEILKQN